LFNIENRIIKPIIIAVVKTITDDKETRASKEERAVTINKK
jgi:hypothetical protein